MLQRKILYVILQTWKYNSVEVEKCCAELTLMQKKNKKQPTKTKQTKTQLFLNIIVFFWNPLQNVNIYL